MKIPPPGLIKSGCQPEVIAMLCTAGHVDHGKTSLVRKLTGVNTDKIKAERDRGLTIETSNAQCYLGNDLAIGIADVPGHEKFIRNMVAGVTGINLALLVIAADDGVMPQTREHCQIMALLGLKLGVVAVTKIDLVTADRIREVTREIQCFLAGTFLAGASICPLSTLTGEGMDTLHRVIVELALQARKPSLAETFRLPIHRVFVKPGSGTIVTGSPQHGRVKVGDRLENIASGVTGRVRAIQRFNRNVASGTSGQCLALSIPEFSKRPPVPGDMLCLPGHLVAGKVFHLDLTMLPNIHPPLRHTEVITFLTGRSSQSGRIHMLDPGSTAGDKRILVTVTLDGPIAAAPHDRFILRRPSPSRTMGGGEILTQGNDRIRPRNKHLLAQLKKRVDFFSGINPHTPDGRKRRVEWFLLAKARWGANLALIAQQTLIPGSMVNEILAAFLEQGLVHEISVGAFIHQEPWQACLDLLSRRLQILADRRESLSIDSSTLRHGLEWPHSLWRKATDELARRGIATFRENKIVFQESLEQLPRGGKELLARIRRCYVETGWHSPRPDQLPSLLDADPAQVDRLLQALCDGGELVRLHKKVIVSRESYISARDLAIATIREKGHLDSSRFRLLLGTTRKYSLAFLDYLDAQHITVRGQFYNRTLAHRFHEKIE